MTTKFYVYVDNEWIEYPVYNNFVFDERLDEQLDTGSIQTITFEDIEFEDFCMIKIVLTDGKSETVKYFYGFDDVEKRAENYYIHIFELVEPTRLLMGLTIDGRKVTQSIDGQKKSLLTVIQELTYTMQLLSLDNQERKFIFYADEKQTELLRNTVSPEFTWEANTLLWEVLVDIANVINCIPRLIPNEEKTAFNTIVFENINEVTGIYNL